MRENSAVCASFLAATLALVAVSAVPASASDRFLHGFVETVSGGATNPWYENKEDTSTSTDLTVSSHHDGNVVALAEAHASPSYWNITTLALAQASSEYRGAVATANMSIRITDRITPTLSPGIEAHSITYVQNFHISGNIVGQSQAPGDYVSAVSVDVEHDGENLAHFGEALSSTNGYTETMPRGNQFWSADAFGNEPFDFRMDISALAVAGTVEDAGSASVHVDFGNTFIWGSVTNVRNAETGAPIDAADFHLYGEDGFDWAHPPEVPEPATLSVIALLAPLFFWRRGNRALGIR